MRRLITNHWLQQQHLVILPWSINKKCSLVIGLPAHQILRQIDEEVVTLCLVQINDETGGAEPQAPFGGMKNSSTGFREQGQAAKEFFTVLKTVTINGIRYKKS